MVDFPTRNNNVLDLILTNTPDKVTGVYDFDDILSTDHKLTKFVLNFNIPKTIVTNRLVYNFKNANWLVSGKFFSIPFGTYVLFQTMLILHGQAGVIYFFRQ